MRSINRREFLRATPAAAVAMSCVTGAASTADAVEQGPAADLRSPRVGDARYSPNLDYPIRPIRHYLDIRGLPNSDNRSRHNQSNFTYWTSSRQTADMANHIDFADSGRQHYDDKDFPRRVRAVRQI